MNGRNVNPGNAFAVSVRTGVLRELRDGRKNVDWNVWSLRRRGEARRVRGGRSDRRVCTSYRHAFESVTRRVARIRVFDAGKTKLVHTRAQACRRIRQSCPIQSTTGDDYSLHWLVDVGIGDPMQQDADTNTLLRVPLTYSAVRKRLCTRGFGWSNDSDSESSVVPMTVRRETFPRKIVKRTIANAAVVLVYYARWSELRTRVTRTPRYATRTSGQMNAHVAYTQCGVKTASLNQWTDHGHGMWRPRAATFHSSRKQYHNYIFIETKRVSYI